MNRGNMLLEAHPALMDEVRESDGGATAVVRRCRQIGTGVGRALR